MGKTALVLSGGSIKGAFQAGAIEVVLKRGVEPNAIYGISVGSLNGGFLADRAGMATNNGNSVNWKEIGKELGEFWEHEIRSFKAIGKEKSKLCILLEIIFSKFNGMLDTGNLHKLVRRVLNEEHLKNCPVIFTAGTVDFYNGKLISADAKTSPDHFLDYIIASTAIPVMMPIFWKDNRPLLDGGIRDVAPLKQAIDHQADEIICILCQPKELDDKHFNTGMILKYAEQLMEIVVNETVNNDIERATKINKLVRTFGPGAGSGGLGKYREIPIKVIRPKESLKIDLTNFGPEDIKRIYELGQQAAEEVMG